MGVLRSVNGWMPGAILACPRGGEKRLENRFGARRSFVDGIMGPEYYARLAWRAAGVWRSLVAHLLWEQGVGGSNPSTPTRIRDRDQVREARDAVVFLPSRITELRL